MDDESREKIALHRFGVIAEALAERLTPAERGALVREIAGRTHSHPDGDERRYTRATIDRWIRAWRKNGLEGLKPAPRSDTGTVRSHPELREEACALRLERPSRSAAQIARILLHRHGIAVSERTVRDQLRHRGLQREALVAEQKTFGRYEAARANERWVTDVLVGPWVPHPRIDTSVRAKLFLIVDDHSRLLVDRAFYANENTRECQDLLRHAIVWRGLPEVLTDPPKIPPEPTDPHSTRATITRRASDPSTEGTDLRGRPGRRFSHRSDDRPAGPAWRTAYGTAPRR